MNAIHALDLAHELSNEIDLSSGINVQQISRTAFSLYSQTELLVADIGPHFKSIADSMAHYAHQIFSKAMASASIIEKTANFKKSDLTHDMRQFEKILLVISELKSEFCEEDWRVDILIENISRFYVKLKVSLTAL